MSASVLPLNRDAPPWDGVCGRLAASGAWVGRQVGGGWVWKVGEREGKCRVGGRAGRLGR